MRCLLIVALLVVPSVGFSGECLRGCGPCLPRAKSVAVKVVKVPVKLVRCVLGR